MKAETLKKANDLADKINEENNAIMAYRTWVSELDGTRFANGRASTPPMWHGTLDNGKFASVQAPVKEFMFLLDLTRMSREKRLAELEKELAALQDEPTISDVEYEEN